MEEKTKIKFDFSGYATKAGLKCTDGRTILKDAFKHQDGKTVPLVWQHLHDDPANVLGHAILENREDGVYCYGKFNETEAGKTAKELVQHGDISSLSIFANQLKEQAKKVIHGAIREVSLVLAGANCGAVIDNLSFAHSDGSEPIVDETEAIIYTGLTLSHGDEEVGAAKTGDEAAIKDEKEESTLQHADDEKTIADVFDTFNDEQKTVVYAMIAHAISNEGESSVAHSSSDEQYNEKGDTSMKTNVFDQSNKAEDKNVLTHDQLTTILADGKRYGSLKDSFIAHAAEYGFNPIDVLFPDARLINPADGPATLARDKTWVDGVLAETTHTPFSRIKTVTADLTVEEARAKGYITGKRKKEEVIPLMKRITTPITIYKKQKLDRDDISDITDFDVVMWLKREMRTMLNEELARAILIGDGRDVSDEDKINEQNIRPIALDNDDVYVHRVKIAKDTVVDSIIDEFIRARQHYRGSGVPSLYTSTELVTEMLLVKDAMGRRIYANINDLASVLRVSKIVEVEVMNNAVRKDGDKEIPIKGIVVNLKDYTIGSDRGGQVAMFDDFDIDYNQNKYLIETRVSGALIRPKSAIVVEEIESAG